MLAAVGMPPHKAAQQMLVQEGFNTMLGRVLEDLEVRIFVLVLAASDTV